MGHEQDFCGDSGSSVRVRKTTVRAASNGLVSFDPNFLSSSYARKVYSCSNPDIITRTKAHKHQTPQMSHVLYGNEIRMAYEDAEGKIIVMNMRPGEYYYIAPNVPHQFESRGPAVLESFSPSALCIKWLVSERQTYNVEPVPDLFSRVERSAV